MEHAVYVDIENGGKMYPLRDYQLDALEKFIKKGKKEFLYDVGSIRFTLKKTEDFPDAHVYQFIKSDGTKAYIAESEKTFSRYVLWRRMSDFSPLDM